MLKGIRHLGFVDGAQQLPLFIPSVLDVLQASPFLETLFVDTCCIRSDSRYLCTVAILPNLRRLRVTSDAVSEILHLIERERDMEGCVGVGTHIVVYQPATRRMG